MAQMDIIKRDRLKANIYAILIALGVVAFMSGFVIFQMFID